MFQEEIRCKLAVLDPHPFEIGPTSIIQGENTFHCIIACMILFKFILSYNKKRISTQGPA